MISGRPERRFKNVFQQSFLGFLSLVRKRDFLYHKIMEKGLTQIFQEYQNVKLVYLFGSRAKNAVGPLSDYDFAVYSDGGDKPDLFSLKLGLQQKIAGYLKTDKVDVVVLNLTESPELKYNIIKDGKLIYDIEPYRTIVEPRILNEYFDFHYGLVKYGLTGERQK